MHLCFGNDKGRSMGPKSIAPMLPDFIDMAVDIIDVKSYYIETSQNGADRIHKCFSCVLAKKLVVAPDYGLS